LRQLDDPFDAAQNSRGAVDLVEAQRAHSAGVK
jgi:hypothetical protein